LVQSETGIFFISQYVSTPTRQPPPLNPPELAHPTFGILVTDDVHWADASCKAGKEADEDSSDDEANMTVVVFRADEEN